ncbi:(d)CMP kinase [Jiulongibacter sediminis]|uniref:Cytidylate kinase n=1 Tax=Jiulongibacter sediminis TaxID=1605367 RepID=A0A0P7BLC3_9BACT|nr:(d)CMP kinase [Jiulongibacter sediminis]KPM48050.1 cytidylate kinase [Jiulongibacter sediminis]TBX24232.1 cytidylate kinase [Jiulongibacter sediminis]
MNKIIIAIDGHSSCGKSSTAKGAASRLDYTYIDTGAMYRAVTLYFHNHHISLSNDKEIEEALDAIDIEFRKDKLGKSLTVLNGVSVENEIRKLYIANKVSEVSALPQVRHAMVAQQRKMGQKKGVVMDGRDIGSVVFPDAELKIFMTADPVVRAHRRQAELMEKGDLMSFEDILENLKKRDYLDSTRKESPLIQVPDAEIIDTSHMTLEEQIELVCILADEATAHKLNSADND